MEDLIQYALGLAFGAILLVVGIVAGSLTEGNHFASLARRERELGSMRLTDLRTFLPGADPARGAEFVAGEVCIATDCWKSFVARLIKIVGGELTPYLSLMERARREAILRMMEEASRRGHNAVCCVRIDTVDVSGAEARRASAMVEVVASGTAYTLRPPAAAG